MTHRDEATGVDLLEEIRAGLDRVDELLHGRVVDIEMARLRVVTDPALFQRVFAGVIAAAVAHTDAPNAITVRVVRAGKVARIEVVNEGGSGAHHILDDVTPEAEDFRAIGGDVGTMIATGGTHYWISLPLVPGTGHAADG